MGLETLALISIGTTVAGTAVSAVGAYQQSKAAQAQAEYNAQVQRNNATIAQQNAEVIRARGEAQEDEHRRKIQQSIGAARAAAAGGGFLIDGSDQDTNILLQADIAEAGELDILRLRDDTELRAREQEIQGVNFGAQAGLFDAEASAQRPGMAAFGTLLEGAGRAAGIAVSGGLGSSTPKVTTGYGKSVWGGYYPPGFAGR